jgi:hypothetical protein
MEKPCKCPPQNAKLWKGQNYVRSNYFPLQNPRKLGGGGMGVVFTP